MIFTPMVKSKLFLVFVSGCLLVVSLLLFIWWFGNGELQAPAGHAWETYLSQELGFSVAYPADISTPYEGEHPPTSEGFPGAQTVNFYDATNRQYFSIWIQDTGADSARQWFEQTYGPGGGGNYISATSTVDGIVAVSVSESDPGKAYDGYDLNFVRNGQAYSMHFDTSRLTDQEVEYIQSSFHFLHWWEQL